MNSREDRVKHKILYNVDTFDALGRQIEENRNPANDPNCTTNTDCVQIVYSIDGSKLALMNGQALNKAYVHLPGGGNAVYTGSGLAYYEHMDWLGSSRLASTPGRTVLWEGSYAPFGESFSEHPANYTYHNFTGQREDTVQGLDDFLFREYSVGQQGRWISPDPAGLAAVDITNPQSWNRYAYLTNSPLDQVDFFGFGSHKKGDYSWDLLSNLSENYYGIFDPFNYIGVPVYAWGYGNEGWDWYSVGDAFDLLAGSSEEAQQQDQQPSPCSPVPKAPPGADIKKNISVAQLMQVVTYTNPALSLYTFRNTVGNKDPWDYKQQGWTLTDTGQLGPSPFQDFGNFNFGATGAAWGIPLNVLLRGAGYAQEKAGTSTPEWGRWYQGPPYGDDPADQAQIINGFTFYKNGCYKKK